jgi:hypothetical protein
MNDINEEDYEEWKTEIGRFWCQASHASRIG